jgi:hypothetical protein
MPLLLGCGDTQRKSADFQLDVHGANWTDTDRVRVCVEGLAVFESALGHGRVAVGALPPAAVLTVSVDLLDGETSMGGVGPIQLTADQPRAQLDWQPCIEGECIPCTLGVEPESGTESVHSVLAIRFADD